MVTFSVSGAGVDQLFGNEAGGHRWQRVPPTEKRGRVQTSTITVAVLPEVQERVLELSERDLEWSVSTAQGNGGQSVNTTFSCVVLKHKPSGLVVRCQNERSQQQNRKFALRVLSAKLKQRMDDQAHMSRAKDRKEQIGSGQRGDKIRTIRVKDGQVNDHVTGRCWNYKDYRAGKW